MITCFFWGGGELMRLSFHHLPAVVDVYPALLGPGDRAAFEVVVSGVAWFHLYSADACRGWHLHDAALEDLLRPAGGTVGMRPTIQYIRRISS